MSWTSERPKKTGWYWYRGSCDAADQEGKPVVIFVSMEGSKSGHYEPGPYAWQPFMDYDGPLKHFEGEWFGPLQPPPD